MPNRSRRRSIAPAETLTGKTQRQASFLAHYAPLHAVAAHATLRGARQLSATAKVWVDGNTRVICQGFTGKTGSFRAGHRLWDQHGRRRDPKRRPTLWGGQVAAVVEVKPDASVIYVPPPFCKAAILDAIENEIGFSGGHTEGVPQHDMVEVKLTIWKGSLPQIIIGPNCPASSSPEM